MNTFNHPYFENGFINFQKIEIPLIFRTLKTAINNSIDIINRLSKSNEKPTWDNFVLPLNEVTDYIDKIWNPIGHLVSVNDSDELRSEYSKCLELITDFSIFVGQNKFLYNKFTSLKNDDIYKLFSDEQQATINHSLKSFELSGIGLDDEKQKLFKKYKDQLTKLSQKFQNNVQDSKQSWTKHVTNETLLDGLPDIDRKTLANAAKEKGLNGWLITLDAPNYTPVLQYVHNRELRKEISYASLTQASDLGGDNGKFDNKPIMKEILALRQKIAQLLGFENYAEYSIASKMASDAKSVMKFINDLVEKCRHQASIDKNEIIDYGISILGLDEVHKYDYPYIQKIIYSEKYSIDENEIRKYFPADKVVHGMFNLVNRLYGIDISENTHNVSKWDDNVKLYDIFENGNHISSFYLDLYTRSNKRPGAWMNNALTKFTNSDGDTQKPVAYLNCNFSPPTDDTPSLLLHREIETLFHEFGHGLHHILTHCNSYDVSGLNNVEWDAVELPSQIMENWCWNFEVLSELSSHYETNETFPKELFDKLTISKNYLSGMSLIRQLAFSRLDMKLHIENSDIDQIINENDQYINLFEREDYNRWENTFSHIFCGGYAAGYYSYLWAEVLSSDAFSLFEKNGLFDRVTGENFRNKLLSKGSSKPAMELFKDFRGRYPKSDALLKYRGIV